MTGGDNFTSHSVTSGDNVNAVVILSPLTMSLRGLQCHRAGNIVGGENVTGGGHIVIAVVTLSPVALSLVVTKSLLL